MEPKERPNRGNAGKGRPKGSPNKINKALKEMILEALEKAHPEGAVAYLVQQAQTNPNPFMALVGRVLPLTLAGDPKNPLGVVTRVELVSMRGDRED